MNDASGWNAIDFGAELVSWTDGDVSRNDIPAAVINTELQELAKEHFPAGPASAVETQSAWLAHRASCAAEKAAIPEIQRFFFNSKRPVPEAAVKWDNFVKACVGHRWNHKGPTLTWVHSKSDVDLMQSRASGIASWRDRLSAKRGEVARRDNTRGRGRGR